MKVRTTIEVIGDDGDVITAVTECVNTKNGFIGMDEDDAASLAIARAASCVFDHRPCGFDSIAILLFAVLKSCENIHPRDKELDPIYALVRAYELWLGIGCGDFSDSIKVTIDRDMFAREEEEYKERIDRCMKEIQELGAEVIEW